MKPLSGQNVLITRPAGQQEPLRSLFLESGAAVFSQPTIEIRGLDSFEKVDSAWKKLNSFDWIVFSSGNGVDHFLQRGIELFSAIPPLPSVLAIGPGTAAALHRFGVQPTLIPSLHAAEGVVASLLPEAKQGRRILLIRADRGRNVMLEQLSAANPVSGAVEEIAAYKNVDVVHPHAEIVAMFEKQQIHWTTCTSSATAASLVRLFGKLLEHTRLISISPITTRTLHEHGFSVAAESSEATMEGIVQATIMLSERTPFASPPK